MVIFQKEVDSYAYMVVIVSIFLEKKLRQSLMICFYAGGHLVHGGHIGVHFEKES